jgi:hypothetical protein
MKPSRLVLLALLIAACGGEAPSDTIQAMCEASCDREQRCQTFVDESREECVAGCLGGTPPASVFKPGVMSSLAACLSQLECSANDDTCTEQVVVAQDPSGLLGPKAEACLARLDTCAAAGSGRSLEESMCVAYFICTAETVAAVDACLAGACETVDACLQGVLGGPEVVSTRAQLALFSSASGTSTVRR